MCQFQQFRFPSSDGSSSCYAGAWLPPEEPRGVVQIVHGVGEHIGRYETAARFLTRQGFLVCGEDHLGHGNTVQDGRYGAFAPQNGWKLVVADIARLRRIQGEKHPGVPYFLLGHSMGSFLARTYLIRYPGTVQGAILMGTGQMSPALVAAGRAVAAREARKVGEDHSSPVVMKLAFDAYNKRFAPNRTAFDWLSVDQGNVDRYLKDPLCGENPTVGLFREMLSGITLNSRQANLKKMNLNTPVLFISGQQDPVGDCGKGVERAAASFRRAGVRDVTVKLYPQLRHELLQEAQAPQVCEDLYQWLTSKLPEA